MKRKTTGIMNAVCIFSYLVAALAAKGITAAESSSDKEVAADVAMVEPFIGESTILVFKVDTTKLAMPKLPEGINSKISGADVAYRELNKAVESIRSATDGQAIYGTFGIPLSTVEWPFFLVLRETPNVDRDLLFNTLPKIPGLQFDNYNGAIVAAPMEIQPASEASKQSPRPDLEPALRSVRNYPIQAVFLPPDYIRRSVTELMPQLPRHLGGGPGNVLTEGVVWAAAGLDLHTLRAELVIQSASHDAAQRLAEHVAKLLQSAYDEVPQLKKRISPVAFTAIMLVATPHVEGDQLIFRLPGVDSMKSGGALLAPVINVLKDKIQHSINGDRFRNIVIAMHNYYDANKCFPPRDEFRDDHGKSNLSWRVHILPFLGEKKLFDQFRLDEPWDSPHNKKLVEKMPGVFQCPFSQNKPGHTTFLAPVGQDTIFGQKKATTFQQIRDGTADTLVLVEVEPNLAVPWTAPQDFAIDGDAPHKGLRISGDGRILTATADGSVHTIPGDIDYWILQRLFQKNDFGPIHWRQLR